LFYVKIWRTYKHKYLCYRLYTDWNESSIAMHPVIRDVAAALGDKAKVIKIDVDKNKN
jgi:thiol-disulfide isomerase/thioredoxin